MKEEETKIGKESTRQRGPQHGDDGGPERPLAGVDKAVQRQLAGVQARGLGRGAGRGREEGGPVGGRAFPAPAVAPLPLPLAGLSLAGRASRLEGLREREASDEQRGVQSSVRNNIHPT